MVQGGFNVGGYNRYAVTFVLDNVVFNGDLLVALNDSSQGMFYDIVKIKENGAGYHPIVAGANTVSNNTIRQNSEKSIDDVKNAAQNEILSKKQVAALRDRGITGECIVWIISAVNN